MTGRVSEIFSSIQGEGLLAGQRQTFMRLYGCNLTCSYCDTKLDGYREFSAQEAVAEAEALSSGAHSISFTGGEPLLQSDFLKEAMLLCRQNHRRTYLETNGTLPDELSKVIEFTDIVAMDFKFPSSIESRDYWLAHREFLAIASQKTVFVKAVVCADTNEDDLRQAVEIIREVNPGTVLVLQPNSFQLAQGLSDKLINFKKICYEEKVLACAIPQMHKVWRVK